MNYYENKMLEDREARSLSGGITFLIFGLPIAFILSIFVAYPLGLPLTPVFYGIWATLELVGVGSIAVAIKEKIDRKRNQNS
jgi:hypothetical protein